MNEALALAREFPDATAGAPAPVAALCVFVALCAVAAFVVVAWPRRAGRS